MSKINIVSVMIPTLNEAGTIGHTIETIRREVKYPYEIIMFDGNFVDEKNRCRLIIEPRWSYSVTLKTGIKHAKSDAVVIVDGDGTYEPKDVNLFIDYLYEENVEMNGLFAPPHGGWQIYGKSKLKGIKPY